MTEARTLGRNFTVVAAAQVSAQVLTFVISIVLARTLGVEQYGIFVFGFAFPSWFLLLVTLGLDSVLTVEVASNRSKAGPYLTVISLLRIPLAVAAFLILWTSLSLFVADPLVRTVTLVLGAANIVSAYTGTFGAIFRAFEKLQYNALVTIADQAIVTTAVLLMLFLGLDLVAISLVYLVSSVLTMAISLAILRARFVWFQRRADLPVKSLLKSGLPFALSAVVASLLYTTAPVFLSILLNPSATGHFNAAFALLLAILAPLQIYHVVVLPTMSRIQAESRDALSAIVRKTQKFFFMLGFPVALGGWFYAEEIVTLFYGEAFRPTAGSFSILILVAATSTAVLGIGSALAAIRRQSLDLALGSMGAVANVVLCLVLIPPLGPLGAAYAFLASSLLTAGLRFTAMHRWIPPVRLQETLAKPAFAGVVMILVLFASPRLPTWIGIPVGAGLYFSVLILAKGFTKADWAIAEETIRGAFVPARIRELRDLRRWFTAFAESECREASPLYYKLSTGIARDPEVLALAGRARVGQPTPYLFLAAVHFLLLKGIQHPLASFYPSVAPRANVIEDPYPSFRMFCLQHREEIERLVADRLVQTNEVQRSTCLLPAFEYVSRQGRRKPLFLVEIGASAGLNLLWDRYAYDYGQGRTSGDLDSAVRLSCLVRGARVPPIPVELPKVAARVGLDLNPIDVRDPEATLWLGALVWPEHTDRAETLQRAIQIARLDPPNLVRGDALEALPTILGGATEEGTVCVFHSYTANQLGQDALERLSSILATYGKSRRLYRVSIEYAWPEKRSQLEVTTYEGGARNASVLAYCDSRGKWLEWIGEEAAPGK